jgi:hypothetical protein
MRFYFLAVHVNLGGRAPRDQQLEMAPRAICIHGCRRILLGFFGESSPVKAPPMTVIYYPRSLGLPMIRFTQLISIPLAEAEWLRTGLLQ